MVCGAICPLDGESILSSRDASAISATPRGQLRVAVRAKEPQLLGSVVPVVPVNMVKDELERLSVPHQRLNVKRALRMVTPKRHSPRLAPLLIVTPDGSLADGRMAILEHIKSGSHHSPMRAQASVQRSA